MLESAVCFADTYNNFTDTYNNFTDTEIKSQVWTRWGFADTYNNFTDTLQFHLLAAHS